MKSCDEIGHKVSSLISDFHWLKSEHKKRNVSAPKKWRPPPVEVLKMKRSCFFCYNSKAKKQGGRLDAVHNAVCAEAYACRLQGWCYGSIRIRHHAVAIRITGKCTEV